jgi:hypothetical protein
VIFNHQVVEQQQQQRLMTICHTQQHGLHGAAAAEMIGWSSPGFEQMQSAV